MLRPASEAQWLRDLGSLLRDAKGRFADVCWEDEGSGRVVYAHKALVYARATGQSGPSCADSRSPPLGPRLRQMRSSRPFLPQDRSSSATSAYLTVSPRPTSRSTALRRPRFAPSPPRPSCDATRPSQPRQHSTRRRGFGLPTALAMEQRRILSASRARWAIPMLASSRLHSSISTRPAGTPRRSQRSWTGSRMLRTTMTSLQGFSGFDRCAARAV